jgi:hypothetical protein
MRQGGITALLVILIATTTSACSTPTYPTPAPVVWGIDVPTPGPEAIDSQPVVSRREGRVTVLPISPTGAVVGIAYRYEMPHCGISSPIDVDGSFWDPVNVPADPVQFDGSPGTFRLDTRTTATFTDTNGAILKLVRHVGPKEFGGCA